LEIKRAIFYDYSLFSQSIVRLAIEQWLYKVEFAWLIFDQIIAGVFGVIVTINAIIDIAKDVNLKYFVYPFLIIMNVGSIKFSRCLQLNPYLSVG